MRMTFIPTVAALLLAATSVSLAQEEPAAKQLREAAVDSLLSERGPIDTFNKLVEAARNAGVGEQAILEARFLYHVDHSDDEAVAALLPDFIRQAQQFKLETSAIFGVEEDWLAVVEYVKAIDAMLKGDKAGFKTHITEAFWLSPRQAAAFAPQIERLRHEEAMSAITLDFSTALPHLEGQGSTTLKDLTKDKKALLLHFWAAESPECVMSLPDFATTSSLLSKNGIAIASLTAQKSPLAVNMTKPYQQAEHGLWAVDSTQQPVAKILRIQQLPAMALVSNEGKILFCGDPSDDQFWKELGKINPEITRPKSEGDYDQ